jgi:hypothetical protein
MSLQELAAKVAAALRDTGIKSTSAWYALRRACERPCALDDAAGVAAVWRLVRGALADGSSTARYWAAVLARELAMRAGCEDGGPWRRALVAALMAALEAAAALDAPSKSAVDAWAQAAQTAACVLQGPAAAELWAADPSLVRRAAAALSAGVALIATSDSGARRRVARGRLDSTHAPGGRCTPAGCRAPF